MELETVALIGGYMKEAEMLPTLLVKLMHLGGLWGYRAVLPQTITMMDIWKFSKVAVQTTVRAIAILGL